MKINMENGHSAYSLLDAVVESTADGILVVSTESKVIIANNMFKKMWKIPDEIFERKDDKILLDFITDQLTNPDEFLNKVKKLYKNPEREDLDLVYFKDGRIFERFSAPFKMENKILGRVWSFSDITKQKEAEKNLIKERLLFRTIIDNLPDAIYAKDLKLRKTLANPSDLKNMGAEKESDVLGKTDFDFYTKETASEFYNSDIKVIKTGKSIINQEENFYDKDGKENWLLTSKIPIKDKNGNIEGVIGVGRNITVRKKNEKIREALYEISESVIVTKDMEELYKKIHSAVSKLMNAENFFIALHDKEKNELSFPYMVDEFDPPFDSKPFGRGLSEYIINKGEPELIDAAKDLELREKGEVELIGTPAAIWLGVPLKLDNKIIGVIVVQDYNDPKAYGNDEMQLLLFISEQIAQVIARRRDSEAIKKYAAELDELNQTKDKFFSIIAHDLKNPFVTMLGFTEILLSDFEEMKGEEVFFYLNEMKKSADLSHSLLQNLLQWSRSQTGRIEFNPQPMDLNKLVEQNFMLIRKAAEKKSITLKNEIQGELIVNADEDMLNTIIRNLLTNAVKFTKANGTVSVFTSRIGGIIEVSIKDSGVGMDDKVVDKLFKLDTTNSQLGTENEEGTGLGLILCKEFVEKHGGKIRVKSKVGSGSTFTFSLPGN